MTSLCNLRRIPPALFAFVLFTASASAAEPGIRPPSDATAGDLKPGSALFFNFYSSSPTSVNVENTRISITNTSTISAVFIRLFFVDPVLGVRSALNTNVCLVPDQTAAFLVSDFDPGITGYLIAVASDLQTECPLSFNFLTGSADIKRATGHQATLPAQAIAARFTGRLPGCVSGTGPVTLTFDGGANGYDRVPRVLMVDKIPSRADGNDTLFIVNRFGGNLLQGSDTIGFITGTLYDEAGNGYGFTRSAGRQFRSTLTNDFPATTPSFETVIPAGRVGWMKFSTPASNEYALFGAIINANPNAQTARAGFSGGYNLRALTLANSVTLTIPFLQPAC